MLTLVSTRIILEQNDMVQSNRGLLAGILTAVSWITTSLITPVIAEIKTAETWQLWQSTSGLFSLQMPGTPETETRNTNILGSDRQWQLFHLESEGNQYLAAYMDLSPAEIEQGSQDSLASFKKHILEPLELDSIDLKGRKIYHQGYPGREFLGIKSDKIVAIRIYLVEQRLYGLLVASDELDEIQRYLNSFQVASIWESFQSQSGNFSVTLPTTPREEQETLVVGEKQLDWKLLRAVDVDYVRILAQNNPVQNVETENLYGVSYTELPEDWQQQDSEALLQKVSSALLNQLNLTTLDNGGRPITLETYNGREFLGIVGDRIFAVRVYQVEQRLYGLYAVSNQLQHIARFFDSFELLSQ